MKLEEAIEKTQYVIDDFPSIYSEGVYDALKLGIEALKRHRENRAWLPENDWLLLPGETL